jgi:hypothetical protein
MAEKKQGIYGGYRNDMFYENFYKNKTAEQAYDATMEYLKKPTFNFEKDCALRAYLKVYGIKFQSSEQRQIEAQAEEIEKLKAQIAAKEVKPVEQIEELTKETENIAPKDFPKGMDKEAFRAFYIPWYEKSQGIKPTGLIWSRAWATYQKNETPA